MKLSVKILIPILLILTFVFVVTNVLNSMLFKQLFLEEKALNLGDHALRETKEVFVDSDFDGAMDEKLREKFKVYTKALIDTSIFRVKIWDKDLKIVYSDLREIEGALAGGDAEIIEEVFLGSTPVKWVQGEPGADHESATESGYGDFLEIFVPINNSKGETKYVLEFYSANSAILGGIQASLNKTIYLWVWAGVVLFIIFYATIHIVIIRRIARLKRIMAKIGAGDLSTDASEKSFDEIGDLSRSFNQMRLRLKDFVDKIEKSEKELEESNSKLSKQSKDLAARTAELERMNKLMVGRELKMVELKKEIKKLKEAEVTNEPQEPKEPEETKKVPGT